jgi:hypothetical protein
MVTIIIPNELLEFEVTKYQRVCLLGINDEYGSSFYNATEANEVGELLEQWFPFYLAYRLRQT